MIADSLQWNAQMARSHYKKVRVVGCFILMLCASCSGQNPATSDSTKPSETESFPSIPENPSLPSNVENSPSPTENLKTSEFDDPTHWGDIKF